MVLTGTRHVLSISANMHLLPAAILSHRHHMCDFVNHHCSHLLMHCVAACPAGRWAVVDQLICQDCSKGFW